MKEYSVLYHERNRSWRALKRGFNIWAFIFSGIWLLMNGLFAKFFLYVVPLIATKYLLSYWAIQNHWRGDTVDALSIVFLLAAGCVSLIIGMNSSAWQIEKLTFNSWKEKGKVKANDASDAITRFKEK